MATYKPSVCPICLSSALRKSEVVYCSKDCKNKGRKLRYMANRVARGLPRRAHSAAHQAKAQEYLKAKYGDDYREDYRAQPVAEVDLPAAGAPVEEDLGDRPV